MNLPSPSTLRRTALLAAALALAGCAAMAPTPEQAVQARASQYWRARMAGDYQKAYAFSTPSYRKIKTAEQYRMQFGPGVTVKDAEVVSVSCETAEKCAARMKISVNPGLAMANLGTIATHLDEIWLLEDGQWWHYQDL